MGTALVTPGWNLKRTHQKMFVCLSKAQLESPPTKLQVRGLTVINLSFIVITFILGVTGT